MGVSGQDGLGGSRSHQLSLWKPGAAADEKVLCPLQSDLLLPSYHHVPACQSSLACYYRRYHMFL